MSDTMDEVSIALVGNSGCGKTQLINKFTMGAFKHVRFLTKYKGGFNLQQDKAHDQKQLYRLNETKCHSGEGGLKYVRLSPFSWPFWSPN